MACEAEKKKWLEIVDAVEEQTELLRDIRASAPVAIKELGTLVAKIEAIIAAGESLLKGKITTDQVAQIKANLTSYYSEKAELTRKITQIQVSLKRAVEKLSRLNEERNEAVRKLEACEAKDPAVLAAVEEAKAAAATTTVSTTTATASGSTTVTTTEPSRAETGVTSGPSGGNQ